MADGSRQGSPAPARDHHGDPSGVPDDPVEDEADGPDGRDPAQGGPDGGGRRSPAGDAKPPGDDALAATELDKMRAAGWELPAALPGGLTRICARDAGDDTVQLAYTDGLFTLSLFVQRGRLGPLEPGFETQQVGNARVQLRSGLFREVIWAVQGMVYTVVTDLPDAPLTQVVGAVPATRAADGVLTRMSRGIKRVGSWVDPFH